MTNKDKLVIFDTTLRDGEQSPGVTLTVNEKIEIAKQLSRLGVDVCEAGFPIASQGDFEAVHRIAKEVGPLVQGRQSPMTICALARAVPGDIKRAWEAISPAPKRRIHTFLATSDIHLKYKLKLTRQECIKKATDAVAYCKSLGCEDIEFSPEDAGRSDKEFLVQVLESVVKAGATTLNIPDTVGYNMPEEYGALIKYLVEHVKSDRPIVFSTHCHNDLGLATANTLAGIHNGARQVEVTVNGIGERAGNTSMEEIVMSIHTHPNTFPVYHSIDTYQIYNASQLVTKKTGMPIQPNKAIVGANAFAHESGIHQDGVLKNKTTYEIINPEILGLPNKALVLGKHSGRNAFKTRIDELVKDTIYQEPLHKNPKAYENLFVSFKRLADMRKSGVHDQDLFALLDEELNLLNSFQTFKFHALHVMAGSGISATATVSIEDTTKDPEESSQDGGKIITDAAVGHGPVHAIFNAINRIVGFSNVLASYEVRAVTGGSDSLGSVHVKIRRDKISGHVDKKPRLLDQDDTQDFKNAFAGQGTDEDILVASAKAYLNAVNKMLTAEQRSVKTLGLESRNVAV
ncbi:2-isopropylmalate synthase [Gorgonomyces haynaldii]|nr:2-isopropylmalate synthase [Gorgonomyces haynaldii]